MAEYAVLKNRMSTDVPTAGLDWEAEDWDPARVRHEERSNSRGGVQVQVAAALHKNPANSPGGNQPPNYSADIGNAQEVTMTTSGGLGESETAGLTMNIVPKQGGNRVSGIFAASGFSKSHAVGQLHRGTAAARRRAPRTRPTASSTSTSPWVVRSSGTGCGISRTASAVRSRVATS